MSPPPPKNGEAYSFAAFVRLFVHTSCPVHNIIIYGWIFKIIFKNVKHIETMRRSPDQGL